jgi:hypothetical protein
LKKFVASLACAAALLPGAASASQYLDSDVFDFVASSNSFTVAFSWADVFSTKTTKSGFQTFEADGKYNIWLTDSSNKVIASFKNIADGVTGDVSGVLNGKFFETFTGLSAGNSYHVLFTGAWSAPDKHGWLVKEAPLAMTAAVPEPETYAMLLAGFGLIGTMVRRRSSRS